MKILFIGNTRLGDAILSTPILNHYNKKNNFITIVCSPLSSEIYSSFCSVKKLIILEKKKLGRHWIKAYSLLDSVVWDVVIDLRNSILSRVVRKKKVFRLVSKNNNIHKVQEYCNLIGLGVRAPKIPKITKTNKYIKTLLEKKNIRCPILVVAPITNWKRKNWPLKNYSELIKKLSNHKSYFNSVILLGSKNERKLCNKLKENLQNKNVHNLAGSLKILEIHELLKICKFFIGNDSGLTHLSAASKIKTLALFGPSKDQNYRPWGKNSYFIRTPESYSELVEVKGYSRFHNTSLMKSLKVEDVLNLSLKIISKKI